MKRFLLDTGIAGDFINRRHGIREPAREEVLKGNRIGIGVPGRLFSGSASKTFANIAFRGAPGYVCGGEVDGMTTLYGKCAVCVAPLQGDVAQPFDQAEIVGALCPACIDQQLLDQGGAMLALLGNFL
jgi:hypothetical protein